MLDRDLASLYGIETRLLTRAVRRNLERFPKDFMFQLEEQEVRVLRSQFGISRTSHGGPPLSSPTPLPNKEWRCSQASYAVREPLLST